MGKIAYSMSDPDDIPTKRRQNPYPLLPKGMRNTQIDQDLLMRIPLRWRPRWPFYDLEKMFADEIIEESNDELLENLSELSEDKKTQLKAIALGELPKEDIEDE